MTGWVSHLYRRHAAHSAAKIMLTASVFSFSCVSFTKLETARLHVKLSIFGHLQLHMLYETCQLADAAKETCSMQERFQGSFR